MLLVEIYLTHTQAHTHTHTQSQNNRVSYSAYDAEREDCRPLGVGHVEQEAEVSVSHEPPQRDTLAIV